VIIRRFGRIDDAPITGAKDRSGRATITEHRHKAEQGER
jgi:hypothetical protein